MLTDILRTNGRRFWPGAAAVFAAVDSPIAPAVVQRYPTPNTAARLGEKRMKAFLASRSHCGRRSPAELLPRLRDAPTADAQAEANGEMLRAIAAALGRLVGEIARPTARIEHAVAELPDG